MEQTSDMEEVLKFDLHRKGFNSNTIAVYFNKKYSEKKFIYVNEKLYYYNGVYWKYDTKFIYLHKFITSEFVPKTLDIIGKLIENINPHVNATTSNDNYDDVLPSDFQHTAEEKKSKRIENLDLTLEKEGKRRKLQHDSFTKSLSFEEKMEITALEKFQIQLQRILNIQLRNQIIKDILIELTNDNIRLNSNTHLFPFENCIWDFKLDQWTEPKPDFFITQTTGYCYEKVGSGNGKDDVLFLNQFYELIQPIKENREYYLDFCSTVLLGNNQKLVILKGPSCSGKSTSNLILLSILGEFGSILPFSVLCSNGGTKINSLVSDYDTTLNTAQLHNSSNFKRLTVVSKISRASSEDNTIMTKIWISLITGEREITICSSDSTSRNNKKMKMIRSQVTLIVEITSDYFKFDNYFDELEDNNNKLAEYIRFSQSIKKTKELDRIYQRRSFANQECLHSIRSFGFDQLKHRTHQFLKNQYQLSQRPDDFNQLKDECHGINAVSRWILMKYEIVNDCNQITVDQLLDKFKESLIFQNLPKQKMLEYSNYDIFLKEMEKNSAFNTTLKRRGEFIIIGKIKEKVKSDSLFSWGPKQ